MILFASGRTDIPAFYSEWFFNRIRAGFIDVRNPYFPQKVTRYSLNPKVVDCILFCTKNPAPLIPHLDELKEFGIYIFVTITPYGKEIEPNVPEKSATIKAFAEISDKLGKDKICWRYDPVFINSTYTVATHIREFKKLCQSLCQYTDRCIISFIDLYSKTKRNFPELKEVSETDQRFLAGSFARISSACGITVESCAEKLDLSHYGVWPGECISRELLERITNARLLKDAHQVLRKHCNCLPTRDIGYYNSCPHLCKYCYANYDEKTVRKNFALHDPNSSFLTGNSRPDDIVKEAKQKSFKDTQLFMF